MYIKHTHFRGSKIDLPLTPTKFTSFIDAQDNYPGFSSALALSLMQNYFNFLCTRTFEKDNTAILLSVEK